MGRDRELKWLAFSLYPISFFLYSPFKGPSHIHIETYFMLLIFVKKLKTIFYIFYIVHFTAILQPLNLNLKHASIVFLQFLVKNERLLSESVHFVNFADH